MRQEFKFEECIVFAFCVLGINILSVGIKELLIIIIELNTLPKTDPWGIERDEWFLTVTEYEWADVWFDLIVS